MKKVLKTVIVVLVVAAVAVGGYSFYQSKVASTATADTSTVYKEIRDVTQGSLSSSLSVVGSLESVQSASLSFQYMDGTAKLASLEVGAGSVVTAGEVLASIDPATYQQEYDQAVSDLQAAQETLDDLQTPATALEIAQADLAVAKAQLALQQARRTLDDLENPDFTSLRAAVAQAENSLTSAQANLVSSQSSSSSQDQLDRLLVAEATPSAEYSRLASENYSDAYYQDRLQLAYNKMMDAQDERVAYELDEQNSLLQAQLNVRKAQESLATAQDNLNEALAGGNPLDMANARVAVQEAEVDLQQAQADRADLDEGTDATDLATAQADVDKKQLAVKNATLALDGTTVVAPFDGTILETNVKVGGQVTASTVVMTVANMNEFEVVTSVDETAIRRVSVGQDANITFDAYSGQTFTGKVLSVPLQGSLQGGIMVYDVPLSLTGAEDLSLLVGMTADVDIQAGIASDALLVPSIALQKQSGSYVVLVPATDDPNGAYEIVPVEVGLSDGTYTQITGGLSAGDRVIVEISTSTDEEDEMQMMGPGGGGGMPSGGMGAPPSGGGGAPR